MSTKYIASNWRLPNQENSSKSDNYGLDFSGSNSFINCGNVTELNGASKLTFNLWIKYDSTLNFQVFLGENITSSSTDVFQVYNWASGILYFWIKTGGVGTVSYVSNFSSLVNIDEWNMLTAVYDGTQASNNDRLSIYLNGGSTNIITNYGTIPTTYPNITDDFLIGKGISGDFNGKLSELSIFDFTLSESQISTLYGSSSLGAGNPMALKPQPVAFWNLADNSASNPLTQPNEAVEDASVFDFDGSNDYINCGNNFNQTGSSAFSISTWVKYTSGSSICILAKANSGQAGYSLFSITSKIYFYLTAGGSNYIEVKTSASVNDGNWHNILITYDGSGNASGTKIYIDGSLDTTVVTDSFSGSSSNTTNLQIGARGSTIDIPFLGKISNTVFWNSDQTTEKDNIYNSGVPATTYTNTPTAWYKLDQSANWEADSSGDWQIPDAVSAYPQSFDFDGSTSYIDVNTISLGTTFTVSCWVNFNSFAATKNVIFGGGSSNYALYVPNGTTIWGNFGGSFQAFTVPAISTGSWYNIVLTRSGANGELFINGQSQGTTTSFGSNNFNLNFIGRENQGSGTNYNLDGTLSNVAVWNSDQSSEISNIYNSGVPVLSYTNTPSAWYKLDNTATFSTNWSIPDASGNGNTGTSSGMTEQNLVNNNVSALNGESSGMTSANLVLTDLTRAVPYDSYSFNFDSASVDYIDCGNPSELDITGSITLSCWVKSSNTAANYKLLIKDNGTSRSFQINTNHASLGPYTYFWLGGGNIRAVSTGVPNQIVDGNWHHIVSVFKSGEYIRMYIDGIQVGNTNVTETTLDSSTSNFIIATDGFGGTVGVDGKVSNVSVFNEALTSTEVLKLYSNGVPQDLSSFSPAPVAWYTLGSNSFWNGSQWTVRDMIGSNDGTGQNIGIDGLVGDSPRSSAGGTGTNIDIPTNLEGNTKWSDNNSWSINMSETARVEDTP